MRIPAEGDLAEEDGQETLSLGSGRLLAVSLDVAPNIPLAADGTTV